MLALVAKMTARWALLMDQGKREEEARMRKDLSGFAQPQIIGNDCGSNSCLPFNAHKALSKL